MRQFRFLDNKDYFGFEDLVFENYLARGGVHRNIQTRMIFDNGWGVSVIQGPHTYGGEQGLYEMAVMLDGEIDYDNTVSNGDVIGYLTPDMVTEKMIEVQKLPNATTNI